MLAFSSPLPLPNVAAKASKRIAIDVNGGTVGFQIAPMIDVVFVIMLFFMVMAGAVKRENELNTTLPGNADTSTNTPMVDEVIIAVSEDGEITLNDDPFDNKNDTALPQLTASLMRLKQASESSKSRAGGDDCQRGAGQVQPDDRCVERLRRREDRQRDLYGQRAGVNPVRRWLARRWGPATHNPLQAHGGGFRRLPQPLSG